MITNKEIIDALHFRHAAKEFDPAKKISKENFETILEAGRLSPSSFGFEPWKFVVVQDPVLREKLKPLAWGAQKQLPTSSHFVLLLVAQPNLMRADTHYINYMMDSVKKLPAEVKTMLHGFYSEFQKADFKLDTDRNLTDWAKHQVYIALANMMTVGALLGVDSCPVEGFKEDQINEFLKNELKVNTDEYGIAVMCGFGYRIVEPREKTRRTMEEVAVWF